MVSMWRLCEKSLSVWLDLIMNDRYTLYITLPDLIYLCYNSQKTQKDLVDMYENFRSFTTYMVLLLQRDFSTLPASSAIDANWISRKLCFKCWFVWGRGSSEFKPPGRIFNGNFQLWFLLSFGLVRLPQHFFLFSSVEGSSCQCRAVQCS